MLTPVPRRELPSWVRDVPLAHRGLHGDGRPENSLAAFQAAVDAGVGVELDVHVTADRVPVVLHDVDLTRVAGVALDVRELALDELREHPLADGSSVPTLTEVLDVLGDAPVMVELKNLRRWAGVDEPVVAEVLDAAAAPRAYVASFHPGSLAWFRRHRPRTIRAQTAQATHVPGVPRALTAAMAWTLFNGRSLPHLLSYAVADLDHRAVQWWRRRGGTVVAWTVRTDADLAHARDLADNVIFEDIPPPL